MKVFMSFFLRLIDLIRNAHWGVVFLIGFGFGGCYWQLNSWIKQESPSRQSLPKKEMIQFYSVQGINLKTLPEDTQRFLVWRDGLWSFPLIKNKE